MHIIASHLVLYSINKPMTSGVYHPKPIPILGTADGKHLKVEVSGLGVVAGKSAQITIRGNYLFFCFIIKSKGPSGACMVIGDPSSYCLSALLP